MTLAIKNSVSGRPFLKNRYVRIGAGLLPAAIITAGLYFGMQAMIKVEDYNRPPIPSYKLTAYVVGPEIDEPDRVKPRPLEAPVDVKAPPPLPKYAATNVPVNFEAVNIGAAPVQNAVVTNIDVPIEFVSIVPDEDIRPISPPVVVYPIKAAQRGIEGTCDVRMDVSPRGEPFNIQPNCTHSVFNSEASRAMSRVQFRPKIYRGQAVERRNVIYPLEFDLS